jgi:hypothetical protein
MYVCARVSKVEERNERRTKSASKSSEEGKGGPVFMRRARCEVG